MRCKKDAQTEIIRLLGESGGAFLSGEAVSESLGISRTAVWKQINTLRKTGFDIRAVPSKGYFLSAGKDGGSPFNAASILSGLKTETIGRNIIFLSETDSTNVRAYELARAGEAEGTAVIADSQSAGKGRLGRHWASNPGVNLYTSVILRPPVPPAAAQNLTFLAAVAVAETITAFLPMRPTVKWPNDILVDGRKVAGILMEMNSEPDRVNFVIAGVGVNLNLRTKDLPDDLKNTATSLMEKTLAPVDRVLFVRMLYINLEKWYKIYIGGGFAPVLSEWKGFFGATGTHVRVRGFNSVVEGICAGVDDDGALLVRTLSGEIVRVISGDVDTAR